MNYTSKKKLFIPSLVAVFILITVGILLSERISALVTDNNIIKPICAKYNCDNNQRACNGFGLSWVKLGYQKGGNANCCGDDANENFNDPVGENFNGAGTTGNSVCCNNATDCVTNNLCYSTNSKVNTGGDSSNDKEVCTNNGGSGLWRDQDALSSLCSDGNWLSNNCNVELTGGGWCDDYDSNPANGYCCGDDRNEYFKKGTDNTSACCNSNSDYVSGGKCYAKNKLQSVR